MLKTEYYSLNFRLFLDFGKKTTAIFDIFISIMSDISNDTCMFLANIAKSFPRYVRQEHTSVGGVSADMDIKISKIICKFARSFSGFCLTDFDNI